MRIALSKIQAIVDVPDPADVHEVWRFMGMVNFLGRHLPHLSMTMQPLTQLLEKEMVWTWGPLQMEAVAKIKELITSALALVFLDPSKLHIVS